MGCRRGGVSVRGVAAKIVPDRGQSEGERFSRSLVYEHARPLSNYVVKLLAGDVQQSEDIVQETLLRAWQHREVLAVPASLRPWLFRVARNLSVDWQRWRAARQVEVSMDQADDATLIAVDRTENVLRRRALVEVLQRLSPQHRDVLMYLYYYGLTQAEVAMVLGIAQGTVKSRAHYALTLTREVLIRQGMRSG